MALLGYWFDRYEGDHSGNLSQIAGMLKAIGLQPGPVLFSGRNYADYADAADAGVLVELPYLAPVRKKLRRFWKKKGRQPLVTELPIGIEGTSRWLRQVGEAAGVDGRLVEAYLQRRTERTLAPLRKMHSRWRNQRVAVFAEAPLAQGVTGLLRELGFEVVLVGIRGSTLGGVEIEGADVLEQPSLARIRDELLTRLRQGELQGVIGSATELAVLRGLDASEVPEGCSPFLLELGFPCLHYHALQQLPVMGFGGVATMAQRLLTAPRLWDDGRAGGVWG